MYRTIKQLAVLTALLLAGTMAGCVMDDIPCDCPGHEPAPDPDNCHIHFQYTGDGTTDLLNDKFEKVDLYVFDEREHLVLHREVGQAELAAHHGVNINLPEEKEYTAVCIGNALQNTATCEMEGKRIDEIFFAHPAYLKGEAPITGNDRNYHGTTALPPTHTEHTVVFHSAHIKVYIEVLGYYGYLQRKNLPDDGPLSLCMKNLSPYMFFNGNLSTSKATYYPPYKSAPDKEDCYIFRFNTLRLDRLHAPELCLHAADGHTLVHSIDINGFLAANPKIDLTKEEAELPLRIDLRGKDVNVTITVPQWEVEEVTPTNL